MLIDIKEYILNSVGDTTYHGNTELDEKSLFNLTSVDLYLTYVEQLRQELLDKLYEHRKYNKDDLSSLVLHESAKRIAKRHVIKEFTHTNFDNYWREGGNK